MACVQRMPRSRVSRRRSGRTHKNFVVLCELWFYKPYESPTDLRSLTWWLKRRGISGIQAEAYAWARVAMATKTVQGGFDETQTYSKSPQEFSLSRAVVRQLISFQGCLNFAFGVVL